MGAFLEDPGAHLCGTDLVHARGVRTVTLYSLLVRLEELGYVTSDWVEDPDENGSGVRRRAYRITPSGLQLAYRVTRDSGTAHYRLFDYLPYHMSTMASR